MLYEGPERRRNRLFVTRNTEYHVHGDVCVAVRERMSGRWVQEHSAIGMKLSGGMRLRDQGIESHPERPEPGDVLCFVGARASQTVMTSALEQVARPPREALPHYSLPS